MKNIFKKLISREDRPEEIEIEGGTYIGETALDPSTGRYMCHGVGKYTSNYMTITGTFSCNSPVSGIMTSSMEDNRFVYEGDFNDWNFNGKGKLRSHSGDIYEGDFRNSEYHGHGILKDLEGNTIEGDFLEGKFSGQGVVVFIDGSLWEGIFLDGILNGKGHIRYSDGADYEGDFVDGKWNGKGILKPKNGEIYDGDFVNNQRYGKGIWIKPTGEIYEGNFINDKPNGKGVWKWTTGDLYEGDFWDGYMMGKGKARWNSGNTYEGDWKYDWPSGKGTRINANGNILEGDWEEGYPHGIVSIKYPNGDWGQFCCKKGERFGYGIFFNKTLGKHQYGFWHGDQLLMDVLSGLISDNKAAEALKLSKEIFQDGQNNFEKYKTGFETFKAPIIECFSNQMKSLEARIDEIEGDIEINIISKSWRSLSENEYFKKMPLNSFSDIIDLTDTYRKFPEILKIGSIKIGKSKKSQLPLLIPFSESNGLTFIVKTEENKQKAVEAIQLIALRLLLSLPEGKCKLCLIDNQSSGQSFSGLFGLDQGYLEKEILDDEYEIRNGLQQIKNTIPEIISQLLGNRYRDLIEYTSDVIHSKQSFQFLLIANFPSGCSKESCDLLSSILKNGPKAGIFCLMTIDYSCKLPYSDFQFTEFRNRSIEYDFEEGKLYNFNGCEILNKFEISEIDHYLPENIEIIKRTLNDTLKKEVKVEIERIPESSFWSRSSAEGVTIPIGIATDNNTISLQLGDGSDVFHALVGGATGKGKTVLLHNLIVTGAKLYSPDELQYILMDYKEGTEFNMYKSLPHLKILSVTSEIEFGISILDFLNEEVKRRGELFKASGVSDFAEYKLSGKGQLARIMVIIDEFQVLLNPQKRTTPKITGFIEDLTRRGRSFGINLVFSTQSLGDVDISISTLGQMGVRIAMSMPEHDCIRILHIDNDVPAGFTKAGQAVYNKSLGRKEGNIIFQIAFIDKKNIPEEIRKFPIEKKRAYIENKFVFDGTNDTQFEENRHFNELVKNNNLKINNLFTDVFIGEPFYLSNKHLSYRIRKQQSSNVMIVGDDPLSAISLAYHSLYQLILQSSLDSKFYIFDMFNADSGFQGGFNNLGDLKTETKIYTKSHAVEEVLELVKTELNRRIEEDGNRGRIFICFMNIGSVRQFRRSEFDISPQAKDLYNLIKDGPEYGIHIIVHSLNRKSLEQIFDYGVFNEFENIILLKGLNPIEFGSATDELVTKEYTGFLISPVCKYGTDKFKIYK